MNEFYECKKKKKKKVGIHLQLVEHTISTKHFQSKVQ